MCLIHIYSTVCPLPQTSRGVEAVGGSFVCSASSKLWARSLHSVPLNAFGTALLVPLLILAPTTQPLNLKPEPLNQNPKH